MSDELSLSVFAIEIDRRPVIAFSAKKYAAAEIIAADERFRIELSQLKSGAVRLCDDFGIRRLRLAHSGEREIFRDRRFGRLHRIEFLAALLLPLDEDGGGLDQAIEELHH